MSTNKPSSTIIPAKGRRDHYTKGVCLLWSPGITFFGLQSRDVFRSFWPRERHTCLSKADCAGEPNRWPNGSRGCLRWLDGNAQCQDATLSSRVVSLLLTHRHRWTRQCPWTQEDRSPWPFQSPWRSSKASRWRHSATPLRWKPDRKGPHRSRFHQCLISSFDLLLRVDRTRCGLCQLSYRPSISET